MPFLDFAFITFVIILVLLNFLTICFQIIAITVGVVSVAVGIGIPVFYENQIDSAVGFPFTFFHFVDHLLFLFL